MPLARCSCSLRPKAAEEDAMRSWSAKGRNVAGGI
ncbi:hypothetical protein BAE44_0023482 [Dichanthelium oligosanthes]|uniref:Uncharacterized protein n=1 Tax=Dichanthelium oligosanthes TaxID=888268 RepID=A0A1E5URK2_9POAL|nr:hypothetical protein BAE44_0023482 [Dichanthelium oligosanthes]